MIDINKFLNFYKPSFCFILQNVQHKMREDLRVQIPKVFEFQAFFRFLAAALSASVARLSALAGRDKQYFHIEIQRKIGC